MNRKKEKNLDSKKVKIGIVGAGFIGQLCHIKNYHEIEDCEIIALAEIRPGLRKKVAEQYKIPNTYHSHKELLEECSDIDGIVAITKRTMTGPVAIDILKTGIPLLTEKPMASTYKQAKKLVEMANNNNVKYNIGYNKRYDEGVQKGKELLDNLLKTKELGNIIYIRVHRYSGTGYCNPVGDIKTDELYPESEEWASGPEWLPDSMKLRYHSYLNTFCHNINLIRYFIGITPNIEYVDLSENKGQLVVMDCGDFNCLLETKNYSDDYWDEVMEIYFEDGCLAIKTPPQQLVNVSAQIELRTRSYPLYSNKQISGWSWSFFRQAEAFISDIKNKKESLSSGQDSLKDMKLIEKMWRMEINQISR